MLPPGSTALIRTSRPNALQRQCMRREVERVAVLAVRSRALEGHALQVAGARVGDDPGDELLFTCRSPLPR